MVNWIKKVFCVHNFEVVKEFKTDPIIELMASKGLQPRLVDDDHYRIKYITDYKCSKCGKLHRKVITN
jgi:hypothetical protein